MEAEKELEFWELLCSECLQSMKGNSMLCSVGLRPVIDKEATELYGRTWLTKIPCAKRKALDALELGRFALDNSKLERGITLTKVGKQVLDSILVDVLDKESTVIYPHGGSVLDVHKLLRYVVYELILNHSTDSCYISLPEFWQTSETSIFDIHDDVPVLVDYDCSHPSALVMGEFLSWLSNRDNPVVISTQRPLDDIRPRNLWDDQILSALKYNFTPVVVREPLTV